MLHEINYGLSLFECQGLSILMFGLNQLLFLFYYNITKPFYYYHNSLMAHPKFTTPTGVRLSCEDLRIHVLRGPMASVIQRPAYYPAEDEGPNQWQHHQGNLF